MPSPSAIIDYQTLGNAERLASLLDAVVTNDTLLDGYHEWRKQPLTSLGHGYQRLVRLATGHGPFCTSCKFVDLFSKARGG